jgi:hypothetical protein
MSVLIAALQAINRSSMIECDATGFSSVKMNRGCAHYALAQGREQTQKVRV